MVKKQIQFPRFLIKKTKQEAIDTMTSYINANLSDFVDGEEIVIRYLANDGSICSTNAVVDIKNNIASLSVEINEHDTLKIVEGEEEPEDKNQLWLTDWEEGIAPASDLKSEVKQLKLQIKELLDLVNKHEYALNNTLAGGDIVVNSEKYDLENKYPTEQPEDSEYKPSYDTGNTEIVKFELYIGNTPLSDYSGTGINLYKGQKYYLKLRTFNIEDKEVDPEGSELHMLCLPSEIATIEENILFAKVSGDTTIAATLYTASGETLSNRYAIRFDYNEKPEYKVYEEPNVHHMLIKKADTLEILQDNINYLCEGEFCWCIEENTLYLKEKAANGTTQLFKINGQGSITPTGETTVTYFVDENGILNITAYDGSVNVDENGILTLVGGVDENGVLILKDTSPNQ